MTTWSKLNGATTFWSAFAVPYDSFPPLWDGGNSLTLLWLGSADGGNASPTLSDIVSGAAPYRTTWTALAGP